MPRTAETREKSTTAGEPLAPCPRPASAADRLAILVATGGGPGFIPLAPGTFGSAVGLALAWGTLELPLWARGVICLLLSLAGWWAAERAGRRWRHDHPRIVIDEVAGQYLTLLVAPLSWFWVGFLLFRAADITKPFPARRLDRMKGGLYTMADDLVAGLYAALVLAVLTGLAGAPR